MTANRQVFHEGERRVQQRAGVPGAYVERVSAYVRAAMPDQHVEFFGNQPVLFMGALDRQGWPWAVVTYGAPGQLCTATSSELLIRRAPPLADALELSLEPGARVGLLGLEMTSRRRNRLNGTVRSHDAEGIRVAVDQSFGNCPQYIQQREVDWQAGQEAPPVSGQVSIDSRVSRAMLAQADTFFIATRAGELGDSSHGVDISHRGGKPGFLHLNTDGSLSFPDFPGNRFFNTLGNIEQDPRVSLFIPDFVTGEALVLQGRGRVDWDPRRASLVEGAERIVDVVPEQVWHVENALPARGRLIERSPTLAQTGTWSKEAAGNAYRRLRIADKVRESDVITSLYLEPLATDDLPLKPYTAGQFLTVRLARAGHGGQATLTRSYSLSGAWHERASRYRISVKREAHGTVSRLLHDEYAVGDVLEVLPPAGDFVLRERPNAIVLVSSGVGITPMIAMLEAMVQRADAGETPPGEVFFIHSARNGREQAFAKMLNAWADRYRWLHLHIAYTRPTSEDALGKTYHSRGRLTLASLTAWLPDMTRSHVYLCGSEGFMRVQYAALLALGMPREHLHHEFFGRGSLESEESEPGAAAPQALPSHARVTFVSAFTRQNESSEAQAAVVEWTPAQGTLLDLAERAGLAPLSNCRVGRCGSCALRLVSGEVHYPVPPLAATAEGEVLLCCAVPAAEAPLVIRLSE
ncbi:pyridoxamine 5'-phosphate oxidase family protein [Halomonas sp. LR3S48]|uniref:2Fe-2S iron-sulfur cluster-binding protein n=1 Tax=Halomonas sp. LR3S48 TaxID=2982694 RepID=UPI0021E3B20F|nr:pyridoxamine 5'-phosphate oxidase family protein [Halomonas sp. LR3S48]UYG04883.1 pyridoxamine 5'-phosphate oxidase family protein [Halomonas sp. LR3S48]